MQAGTSGCVGESLEVVIPVVGDGLDGSEVGVSPRVGGPRRKASRMFPRGELEGASCKVCSKKSKASIDGLLVVFGDVDLQVSRDGFPVGETIFGAGLFCVGRGDLLLIEVVEILLKGVYGDDTFFLVAGLASGVGVDGVGDIEDDE